MTDIRISNHPLIRHKLTLLRNKSTEPKKFRELIREIAILLAYEATQDLATSPVTVETPMGSAAGHQLTENIGLVPILRAGLGMVEGIWEMMPSAEVWPETVPGEEAGLFDVAPPEDFAKGCARSLLPARWGCIFSHNRVPLIPHTSYRR